jgi:hypothetical protein
MNNLKLSLLIVALMTVTMASAQLSFGVKGGLNVSNVSSDFSTNARTGFNIGLLADYELTPNTSIQ